MASPTIPREILAAMLRHARQKAPRECVGLLFGRSGRITRRVALPNVAADPERRFYAEPGALLRAFRGAEYLGEEHLGIYHSHPQGPDTPSPTDLAEAGYDVPAFLILPATGTVRAFELAGHGYAELPFTVEDDPACGSGRLDRPDATGDIVD